MTIGESKSRIEMFVRKELGSDNEISDNTKQSIAKAISKAIYENNHEIEKELRKIRGLID